MFLGQMKESEENGVWVAHCGLRTLPAPSHPPCPNLRAEIPIPNIDPPVFTSILEFLYTGTLELKVDTVFQIYKSADQYLLDDVKSACRSFINISMTQEHALTLLENARSCKFMEIYQVLHPPSRI